MNKKELQSMSRRKSTRQSESFVNAVSKTITAGIIAGCVVAQVGRCADVPEKKVKIIREIKPIKISDNMPVPFP